MSLGSWLRTFLSWLLGCLAPLAIMLGAVRACCDEPGPGRFTILQLNDVYRVEGVEGGRSGGLARVRTLRRRLENESPVLVLHAGDVLGPAVLSRALHSRPMIRTLNLLDGAPAAFDRHLIATFGNHEFDEEWPDLVAARVLESDFAWVSSNVRFRWGRAGPDEPMSKRLRHVHESLVVPLGGLRVGILGLTLGEPTREWLRQAYAAEPERDAAVRSALERLARGRADVVVALTHQELADDIRLAERFPEIDLVVGGHDHSFVQQRVGSTWITKSDADATSVVTIEVAMDSDGKVSACPQRIPLDGAVARDAVVEGEVEKAFADYDAAQKKANRPPRGTPVARTRELLEGIEPAVRGRETALGNFLADVARETLATDLAFVNGGSIRLNDNIPAGGVLTEYDMDGIFYYDGALVRFPLTGKEIVALLERSVAGAHLAHGRFLQVSGLKFRYHVDLTAQPPRVTVRPGEVLIVRGGTEVPLEPETKYSVATLEYLWKNGYRDGYELFSAGKGGTSPTRDGDGAPSFRQATEEAIKKRANLITNGIEGRIVRDDA